MQIIVFIRLHVIKSNQITFGFSVFICYYFSLRCHVTVLLCAFVTLNRNITYLLTYLLISGDKAHMTEPEHTSTCTLNLERKIWKKSQLLKYFKNKDKIIFLSVLISTSNVWCYELCVCVCHFLVYLFTYLFTITKTCLILCRLLAFNECYLHL